MAALDFRRIAPILFDPQATRATSQRLALQGQQPPDPNEIRQLMTPPEDNALITAEQAAEGAIQGAAADAPGPTPKGGPPGGGAGAGDPKMQALMMALGSYKPAESDTAPLRASASQPRGATPSPQIVSDLYANVAQQRPQSPVAGFGQLLLGG